MLNFSCIQMLFISFVLRSLRLAKGQTIYRKSHRSYKTQIKGKNHLSLDFFANFLWLVLVMKLHVFEMCDEKHMTRQRCVKNPCNLRFSFSECPECHCVSGYQWPNTWS